MSVCPVDAINTDWDAEVAVIDEYKCIGCGNCQSMCPTNAIDLKYTGYNLPNNR